MAIVPAVIAFVHINKTGGTSVKFILRNSFGWHHCDAVALDPDGIFRDHDLRFARRIFPALRSLSGHPLRHPSAHLPAEIGYFTFVRDPVTRAASHFQHFQRGDWRRRRKYRRAGGQKKPTLEEFCDDPRWRNLQTRRIAGVADFDQARKEIETHYFLVGLTERFQESLGLLLALSPHPIDPRYRRLKTAPDDTLKHRLLGDPGTRRLLASANEADAELHDWVRSHVFPRQLERVGPLPSGGLLEVASDPWRYRVCRLYNNVVYRSAVRLRKRRSALP
jgi:hypothetical protein